jgi:hypothetical protein
MGGCVESDWATFSATVALAGFAIRPGWRRSPNLAAAEALGAFRARGAAFGADAGATATGPRDRLAATRCRKVIRHQLAERACYSACKIDPHMRGIGVQN